MISKKFNFSYGELSQRCDRVSELMTRDAAEFANIGYNAEYITAFTTKTVAFKTLESDTYWQGQQMLKTDNKNNIRRRLSNLISEFRFRAKLALGEESVEYRSFRFSRLANLDENQLIIYASHITKTATPMLEKLAIRRIDEATLQEIEAEAQELDNAIDEQKAAISLREQKSFERMAVANDLYTIMSEVCEVGKRIWEGTNEAFYDDYLIYGSQAPINDEEEVPEEEQQDTSPVTAAP